MIRASVGSGALRQTTTSGSLVGPSILVSTHVKLLGSLHSSSTQGKLTFRKVLSGRYGGLPWRTARVIFSAKCAYTMLLCGFSVAFHGRSLYEAPEKAIAGTNMVSAAQAAAPVVPDVRIRDPN